MKTLALNQMETIEGEGFWGCLGGFTGLAVIAVGAVTLGVLNPELGVAVFLSGEGASVAAGITATSLAVINSQCN